MKKLMIAAVAAAMIGGAEAVDVEGNGVGIMYNVQMSLKTLMPTVYSTLKTKGCPICPTTDGEICYLFEQGTLKINGIFANCDCGNAFEYCYFWLNSGKKAIPLDMPLFAGASDYDDLLEASEWGLTFDASRFSKSFKKVVAELKIDRDDVKLNGVGFGTYTQMKYSTKKDEFGDTIYTLKTPAKISVSGNVTGEIPVALLLKAQGIPLEDVEFCVFEATDACTVEYESCTEGIPRDLVPAVGTFTIKPTAVKPLNKIIPANCFEKILPVK